MDKWNGRNGVKVDLAQRAAARAKKDPKFAVAFHEASLSHSIARDLAKLRMKAGLSQRELADKLHTSQAAISRLERPDYQGYTITTLEKYARAAGAELKISFRLLNALKVN